MFKPSIFHGFGVQGYLYVFSVYLFHTPVGLQKVQNRFFDSVTQDVFIHPSSKRDKLFKAPDIFVSPFISHYFTHSPGTSLSIWWNWNMYPGSSAQSYPLSPVHNLSPPDALKWWWIWSNDSSPQHTRLLRNIFARFFVGRAFSQTEHNFDGRETLETITCAGLAGREELCETINKQI